MLLDMIMNPGIDGRETYKRIKQIHPAQKALIVSGFSETEMVKETQKMGAGRYLKKPLLLEKLAPAVKEELAKVFRPGNFPANVCIYPSIVNLSFLPA